MNPREMRPRFQMEWDVTELARAFRVREQDIQEYLTDGRRVSFIIERQVQIPQGSPCRS